MARYKEDPVIRSLRVRTWFRAVQLASGLTAAGLERKFSKATEGQAKYRSCIWDKYRRGEVVPRSRRAGERQFGLVEEVERCYPGTAAWLSSPLWRLADKAPMEMSEIRRFYEGLPKLMRSIFLSKRKPQGLFWRRPVDAEDACEILVRFRDVDSLVAVLIVLREAETAQDSFQHYGAWQFVDRYLAELAVSHLVLGGSLGRDLHAHVAAYSRDPGYPSFLNSDLTT